MLPIKPLLHGFPLPFSQQVVYALAFGSSDWASRIPLVCWDGGVGSSLFSLLGELLAPHFPLLVTIPICLCHSEPRRTLYLPERQLIFGFPYSCFYFTGDHGAISLKYFNREHCVQSSE